MTDNDWNEYKVFVVQELRRSNDRLESIEKRLSHIEREIAVLKTKMYVGASAVAIIFSSIASTIINLFLTIK